MAYFICIARFMVDLMIEPTCNSCIYCVNKSIKPFCTFKNEMVKLETEICKGYVKSKMESRL